MKLPASKRQVNGRHYADLAIQPSEFIHRNRLGWCEGNAVKYICRHGSKHGRQDIEKAIHYLELLLEWEYGETTPAPVREDPVVRGPDPHDVSRDSEFRDVADSDP